MASLAAVAVAALSGACRRDAGESPVSDGPVGTGPTPEGTGRDRPVPDLPAERLLERARSLRARGELESAEAHLAAALGRPAPAGGAVAADRTGAAIALAEVRLQLEEYEGALEAVERARGTEGGPRAGARLRFLEGRALAALGRLEAAERTLERSVAARPRNAASRLALGEVLLLRSRPGEALPHLEEALDGLRLLRRTGASLQEAHYLLGRAHRALGHERRAAEHFTRHREVARAVRELGRLERAAHNGPDDAAAWARLGLARCRHGRLGRATEALERALELAPRRGDLRAALAACLARRGKDERAEAEARHALEQRESAEARFALAVVFERRGERDAARRELARALRLAEEATAGPFRERILRLAQEAAR